MRIGNYFGDILKGKTIAGKTISKAYYSFALNDNEERVRCDAIIALVEQFRNDPQTLPLVRDRAVKDTDEWVRGAAVESLAKYFRDDPETVPLLRDRAVMDESPRSDEEEKTDKFCVREAAINALAKHWPTHPHTLPLLCERAENAPIPWLRERAKELLEQSSKKK